MIRASSYLYHPPTCDIGEKGGENWSKVVDWNWVTGNVVSFAGDECAPCVLMCLSSCLHANGCSCVYVLVYARSVSWCTLSQDGVFLSPLFYIELEWVCVACLPGMRADRQAGGREGGNKFQFSWIAKKKEKKEDLTRNGRAFEKPETKQLIFS